MLSLAVCRKCVDVAAKVGGRPGYYWGPHDDEHWKERSAVCCPKNQWHDVVVKNPPEKFCPHMFEHSVAVSMESVNIDKKAE